MYQNEIYKRKERKYRLTCKKIVIRNNKRNKNEKEKLYFFATQQI